MIAVRKGNSVTIANIADAMTGLKRGYSVELHCKPEYVFYVEAESVDAAQRIVVNLLRSEGIAVPNTGATVQSFEKP